MELGDFFSKSQAGEDGQAKASKSPLVSLQKDLDFYKDSIKEVAEDIISEELSDYPIFVAHQEEVTIGELILDRNELGTNWSIHASMLEEFLDREVIKADKKARFIKFYKNPSEYICLFVVTPEGANFVFYPYVDKNK